MRKTGASRGSGRAVTTREKGEAHSIRQMIERAAIDFAAGRSRIFISGLSAGAAILHFRLRRICAGVVQRFLDAFARLG